MYSALYRLLDNTAHILVGLSVLLALATVAGVPLSWFSILAPIWVPGLIVPVYMVAIVIWSLPTMAKRPRGHKPGHRHFGRISRRYQ